MWSSTTVNNGDIRDLRRLKATGMRDGTMTKSRDARVHAAEENTMEHIESNTRSVRARTSSNEVYKSIQSNSELFDKGDLTMKIKLIKHVNCHGRNQQLGYKV